MSGLRTNSQRCNDSNKDEVRVHVSLKDGLHMYLIINDAVFLTNGATLKDGISKTNKNGVHVCLNDEVTLKDRVFVKN